MYHFVLWCIFRDFAVTLSFLDCYRWFSHIFNDTLRSVPSTPIAQRLLWASRKGIKRQKSPLIPQRRNEGRVEGDECRKLFHYFATINNNDSMFVVRGVATRKVVGLSRCGSIRCVRLNARGIHHFD